MLKKQVQKMGKKKKDEAKQLEKEMQARHQSELKALEERAAKASEEAAEEGAGAEAEAAEAEEQSKEKKVSRAQKRREKKAAEEVKAGRPNDISSSSINRASATHPKPKSPPSMLEKLTIASLPFPFPLLFLPGREGGPHRPRARSHGGDAGGARAEEAGGDPAGAELRHSRRARGRALHVQVPRLPLSLPPRPPFPPLPLPPADRSRHFLPAMFDSLVSRAGRWKIS